MYLILTPHFRGNIPIDIGGFVVSSRGPVQVPDALGQRLVGKNFPYCVPCDGDGKYLGAVPPVKVAPKPPEKVIVSVEALKADAPEEKSVAEDEQPVIEEVTDKKKRK
jgi:hypothetical protein